MFGISFDSCAVARAPNWKHHARINDAHYTINTKCWHGRYTTPNHDSISKNIKIVPLVFCVVYLNQK